jgi:hypothetical protein
MWTVGEKQSKAGISHQMINDKMRNFIKVSRGYLEFLRNDEKKDSRGMARAFLFENLLKSLILIVDDILTQF